MAKITNEELIKKAKSVAKPKKLSWYSRCGDVGCALISEKGKVFTGICIDCSCGIGFCAEHTAIANMLTNKESRIKTIVGVTSKGKILSPCGRCRELIFQINEKNIDTDIIVGKNKVIKLKKLLPDPWQKRF